jgi:hypothetical protein
VKNGCTAPDKRLETASNLLRKEAIHQLKILKAIMLVAIAASVLSLGACAHRAETTTTTGASSSTRGYSK